MIAAHGETQPGTARLRNEDHFLVASVGRGLAVEASSIAFPEGWSPAPSDPYIGIVADGIGGDPHGELASAFAVREVAPVFANAPPVGTRIGRDRLGDAVQQAIERIQVHVHGVAGKAAEQSTPRSSLTVAYLRWPDLFLVHIGHSRCYLMRAGHLWQATNDHTLVVRTPQRGDCGSAYASRKRLVNAIGSPLSARADIDHFRLYPGDRVLLCTDGLYRPLGDHRLANVLGRTYGPRECVERLVDDALSTDADDNLTAVLMHVPP